MKHERIIESIDDLSSKLNRLESVLVVMEEGDRPQSVDEKGNNVREEVSLTAFLNRTPEDICHITNRVESITNRLNDIFREESPVKNKPERL